MNYTDFQFSGDSLASLFSLSSWLQPAATVLLLAMIGVCVALGVVAAGYWLVQIQQSQGDKNVPHGRLLADASGQIRHRLHLVHRPR